VTDQAALDLLESAKQQMGVTRAVSLVVVEQLSTPAVFGLRQIHLLLPPGLVGELTLGELRMVFLHELAHVKRNDMLWNWVLVVAQFVHWFNPLVWLAMRRLRADRELVCDAMVLRTLKVEQRLDYGQVLVKLLESYRADAPRCASAIPVIGGHREAKQRILMITHHRSASRMGRLGMALLLAALGCATLTRARETKPKVPDHVLTIFIDAEGNLRLGPDATPIAASELEQKLRFATALNPDLGINIRADRTAPFGRIVKVMDAAKEARVTKVNATTGENASPVSDVAEERKDTATIGVAGPSSPPPGTTATGNLVRIDVRHIGPAQVGDESIRSNMRLVVGRPFDRDAVDDDVRRLYATGDFYNIHVTADSRTNGMVATYVVQENPRIKTITFTGNNRFSEAELLAKISSRVGGPLRDRELFGDTETIKQMYDQAGLRQVQLKYLIEVDEPTGVGVVTFRISEGAGDSAPAGFVYLSGQAQVPGRYPYTNGLTLSALVRQAGGLTSAASDTIRLEREGEQPVTIHWKTNDQAGDSNIQLRPGDRLFVPKSQ
jgi:biopolymer transport protein ExbD